MNTALLLLLLLLAVCASTTAKQPHHPSCDDEQQAYQQPDVRPTAAEVKDFLRQSLQLDLQQWRGRQLSMFRDFDPMWLAARNSSKPLRRTPGTVKFVLIYNNTILMPDSKRDIYSCEMPCYNHAVTVLKKLSKAMQAGLKLPNVMFAYFSGDVGICESEDKCEGSKCSLNAIKCPVPVFSHIKSWGGERGRQRDLLVPQLQKVHSQLYNWPPENKSALAFFRGTTYCSRYSFDTCSRIYLAYKSRFHNISDVSIGLVNEYGNTASNAMVDAEVAEHGHYKPDPLVSMRDHGQYRWLVSLDGHTASFRFGELLHHNSVVLKQSSHWAEYFYRALQPGTHYLEFWTKSKDDLFELVPALNQRYEADSGWYSDIATRAQQFAAKFLTPHARLLYWRAALTAYKALLPDMDQYVEQLVQRLEREGKMKRHGDDDDVDDHFRVSKYELGSPSKSPCPASNVPAWPVQ